MSQKVIVAESAGFCFGVQRAVAMCEEAAGRHKSCVTLGPVIHNEHVVEDLKGKGVRVVSDISEITPEDTVIVRAHGAGKEEQAAFGALNVNVIDATCPYVNRIHDIVRRESGAGRFIVIIGQRCHPEVAAISSWCEKCGIFETPQELSHWLSLGDNAQKPISIVFQTTNTESLYKTSVEIIKKECTNIKLFDTICGATCKRQQEAAKLSKIADVMIVIGGKNSANSLNLADVCEEHCQRVLFVHDARDLEGADIRLNDTVGVTAGASTPAWIIKEVTRKMSEEVRLEETRVEDAPENSPSEPDGGAEGVPVTENSESEIQNSEPEAPVEPVEEIPAPAGESEPEPEPEPEPDAEPEAEAAPEAVEEPLVAAPETVEEPAVAAPEATQEPEPAAEPEPEEAIEQTAAPESFEEMLEKSIKTLHTGEKVTGVITSITATEVSVELGTKQSGYIPIAEFTDDINTNIDDIIRIGDTIETFVMRVNDVEGMVMLSKKRLDAIKNWDIVEAAKESRAVVEGIVVEENKGGVVVNVKGVRVFVPASQTGLPKSAPMTELVKKPVKLRITEVNQSRRRVVGSIRAVQNDERRERSERVWNDIEVGKKYDGVVKSMTSYGVFVDIGGVDGMIHISELSWTRIKQPSEVMSVGDNVSVYVLSFDRDNRKISLGYKKSEDNPWTKFTTQNAVGDVVNVKIVKMMPFGAFAEICPGVDGLIHISQITDHRIGLPSEVLSDGQLVNVKITEIDNDRKKVSLSIRALIEPASQPLTEKQMKSSAAGDNAPVVVYDTDAPPPLEEDEEAEEPAVESPGLVGEVVEIEEIEKPGVQTDE